MAFIYRVTLVFFVLSFTALSQSKTTDAQFDGLKGKVKSVRTYDSDIETKNGKQVRTERRLVFSDEYDSYGRQRSNSNYVIGIRNNFAVIDGDKTSIWEHFAVPGPSGFAIVAASPNDTNTKRDLRYEVRYKYDYDDRGRIVEERRYTNDGTLSARFKYLYDDKGQIIEELIYDNAVVSEKISSVFDKNGFLSERRFIPLDRSHSDGDTLHRFRDYKLDNQGNWIERTQTTIYFKDGKEKKLESVAYREISYFN